MFATTLAGVVRLKTKLTIKRHTTTQAATIARIVIFLFLFEFNEFISSVLIECQNTENVTQVLAVGCWLLAVGCWLLAVGF
jgi:hypothetical protein